MLANARLVRRAAVVVAIASVAVLAAVASAALIGPGNLVTVCIPKDGTLRVVDSSTTSCPGTQTRARLAAVNADGEVADADRLDGMNSSEFLSGYVRLSDTKVATGNQSVEMEHHVDCPTGKKAIGGGLTALHRSDNGFISLGEPVAVAVSRPETASYFAKVKFPHEAPAGFRHELTVTVVCANAE